MLCFVFASLKGSSFSPNFWPSWTSPPPAPLLPSAIWTRTRRRRPVADRWDWKTFRVVRAQWASQSRRRTPPSRWRRWPRWRAGSRRWLRLPLLWSTANRTGRRCTFQNSNWTSNRAGRRRTTTLDTSSQTQSESDWVLDLLLVGCSRGGAINGRAQRKKSPAFFVFLL